MAYGINPAVEQQNLLRNAKGREDADDIIMLDTEEDLNDDIGTNQPDSDPEPDPVDYELLMSVAHGLGRWMQDTQTDQKVYVKDQDCIGCLKDLQRFLRRDDLDIRPVFKRLGEWRIAATDLVPLLVTYPHDKEVTLQAVKVLTYLTMPVDPSTAKPEVQEGYVRDVKEAMLQSDALIAVLGLVAEPLAVHPRMSPEQQAAVQLVLVLLRNLLAVPDQKPSLTLAAGSSRTRLQASLLSLLFAESIMELLLVVAQHGTQAPLRKEMPTLLEILYDTYRDITPQQLLEAKPPPPPRVQQRKQQQSTTGLSMPAGASASAAPTQSGPAAGNLGQRPANADNRPSPAAFHPSGTAGRGVAPVGHPAAAPAAPGTTASGPPRPCSLDSAVAAQLRRQQLANAAKFKGMPGAATAMTARPGNPGGRFVVSHLDDPGQRKMFMTTPRGGATAATTVKQHIVEAPPKMRGPRAPGSSAASGSCTSSGTRRDAGLMWKLRCFADDLLESGYNQVMEVIRREVAAGVGVGRLERPDLLRFMRLAAFFSQYCRLQQEAHGPAQEQKPVAPAPATAATKGRATADSTAAPAPAGGVLASSPTPPPASPFAGISGTMGWDTFHLVCKLWVEQADTSNKHKDWELQAVSMRLLCEMLAVLVVAHRHGTRDDRQAADRLQRRLLHDDMQESGLLPVLSRLMTSFVPSRQSRSYACDLIMSLHYVLRMYDRLTALEPGGFLVRSKKRRGGRSGGRREQQQQEEEDKEEGEEEGDGKVDNKEEAEEGDNEEGEADKEARRSGGSGKAPLDELADGSGEEDDEDKDEEGGVGRSVVERPLDLASKVRGKLAQPAVIYFAVQLLACYRSLPSEVPRAIASLLYRIAAKEHLDLEPMLYQISVLRVFYALLSDPELRSPAKLPAYREVLLLATQVVRNLFRKLVPEKYHQEDEKDKSKEVDGREGEEAEQEPKRRERQRELVGEIHDKAPRMLLVDLLFWKDHTAAAAINQEYWLWMALDDREREEAEARVQMRSGGEAGRAGGEEGTRPCWRGQDVWGDDTDGDAHGGGKGRSGDVDAEDRDDDSDGGEGALRTAGRLHRTRGLLGDVSERAGSGGEGNDQSELADDDGEAGGSATARRRLTSALRQGAALGFGDDDYDEEGDGGEAAAGKAAPGPSSQGGRRGAVMLSDAEEAPAAKAGLGRAQDGVKELADGAAGAPVAAEAVRKPLTLREREDMLRKRFMKTIRVGNGRNKRSGHAGGDEGADGGAAAGGRGLRLSSAQQALLLQLFERNNASRHNADLILDVMKRGGATGGVGGEPAHGEAVNAAGVEMSLGQLMRQLKKMGSRFKQLTENQVSRLQELHGRYRDDPDCLLMIAAQLPGGWTSKDIKRLLIKHGMTKFQRRGRRGANSGSASASGDNSEENPDVAALDEEEQAVLSEQHGGQSHAVEKTRQMGIRRSKTATRAAKRRGHGLLSGGKTSRQRRVPSALAESSSSDKGGAAATAHKRTTEAAATGYEGGELPVTTGDADQTDGEGRGGAGGDADAPRRALAKIARRRQEQARRMQEHVKGSLVPAAAPSVEELWDDNRDDGEEEHENVGRPAGLERAVMDGEGPTAGSRRRRSGGHVRDELVMADVVNARAGVEGDDDPESPDGRGVGAGKRRRLLRKADTTGKENVGLVGPGGVVSAGGKAVTVAAMSVNRADEEMIELEDELEDF